MVPLAPAEVIPEHCWSPTPLKNIHTLYPSLFSGPSPCNKATWRHLWPRGSQRQRERNPRTMGVFLLVPGALSPEHGVHAHKHACTHRSTHEHRHTHAHFVGMGNRKHPGQEPGAAPISLSLLHHPTPCSHPVPSPTTQRAETRLIPVLREDRSGPVRA